MTQEELKAAGLTPEIIKDLGIATQDASWEDATIEWVDEAHKHLVFDDQHKPSWRE